MARVIESEKVLEQDLRELIEKDLGGMCIKMVSCNIVGLPDRICLLPGKRVFFVEVKTTGKKPRKIQEFIHNRIRALGFKVYILDSTRVLNEIRSNYEQEQSTPVSE